MTWTSSMSSGYSSWEESESEEFSSQLALLSSGNPSAQPNQACNLQSLNNQLYLEMGCMPTVKALPYRVWQNQWFWNEIMINLFSFTIDVQKERETHNYLSKEAIKEKVQIYNSDVTDKLKMTLNASGIYTGFIKVQIELCRPITLQTSVNVGKHLNSNETTFYLPNGYMNTLHISSTNTVREVIEALLKKFLVADNPAKFALYKQCHKEDQVYMCKLSETEHPLYLRLAAGPRTDTLSFVLREHESGEVLWEAFSLPELQNFLRILDKEEDEQLQTLKRRYAVYRKKLEEALGGVWIQS